MASKNRRYVTMIFVVLIASVAFAMTPPWKTIRMYMSGAVTPDGSRMLTSEQPSLWLSVEGQRWVSSNEREEAMAYCAFIIPPQGSRREDGGTSGGDGFYHINTLKWVLERDIGGGSREVRPGSLTICYYGVSREVVVGRDTYSLADGNLFVIHLDDGWQPHVTQIKANLSRIDEFEEARQLVTRAFPDDEAVKALRHIAW